MLSYLIMMLTMTWPAILVILSEGNEVKNHSTVNLKEKSNGQEEESSKEESSKEEDDQEDSQEEEDKKEVK